MTENVFLKFLTKKRRILCTFLSSRSIVKLRAARKILHNGGDILSAVIAITNQKGGVGKTTTSSALLAGLQQRGNRVLGVDLDPQGSLGFCLGLDIDNCATIYDVMKGTQSVRDVIVRSECGDIVPSNILLSGAELEFNKPGREFLLKNALRELQDEYDFIIVDTPPALNVLTVNAYVVADGLVIPMAPEILSLLGVAQIRETIDTVRRCYNSRLKVLGILLNKFNQRFTLNREVLDMAGQIAAQLDTKVFETKVRTSVSVAEAPAHGESVLTYAPSSKPAEDFQALVEEIIAELTPRKSEDHT
jgi:chromosome partitioning protein